MFENCKFVCVFTTTCDLRLHVIQDHHAESLKEFQEAAKCESAAERLDKTNIRLMKLLTDELPAASSHKQAR